MSMIEHHHVFERHTTVVSIEPGKDVIASIAGGALSPNATYVAICKAKVSNNTTDTTHRTVCELSVEGAVVPGSRGETPRSDFNNSIVWYFVHKFTVGASPTAVEILGSKLISGSVMGIDHAQILLIRLDDDLIEGIDYKFGNHTTQVLPATSWEDKASITFQADQVADWAVWGNFVSNEAENSSLGQLQARMVLDGASSGEGVEPFMTIRLRPNGWGDNEIKSNTLFRVYKSLSTASHTVKVQTQSVSTNDTEYVASALFALNLNRFTDVQSSYTSAQFPFTGGWMEVQDASVTPTVDLTDFVSAWAAWSISSAQAMKIRHQIAGVSLTYGMSENEDLKGDGNSSISGTEGASDLGYMPGLADSLQDIDIDADYSSGANDFRYRSFAQFSLELADVRKVQGTILENGAAVARSVVVYRQASPFEKLGETISDGGTGAFTINNLPNVLVCVRAIDNVGGDSFNDLVFANVQPVIP